MSNTSINETYIIEGIGETLDFSACTAIFTNALKSCSGNTTIELGENIIVFNGNALAAIISATTYYGDGSNLTGISTQDTYVTGGTYSAGTAVFTNNTGGTFSVTGFSISNATQFTGGTVTGSTIFTDGLSANTFSATTYFGLPLDITVTGGTYSYGTAEFTNNTGGTFNVTGFTTPFTGGTVDGQTVFTDGLSANTFSLTTTPNTNTTDTDVLIRNQSTGLVEKRSINSLNNVVNLVTVGLLGSNGVDYNSIKEAVNSITGASASNTYVVKVGPGVFYEDPITMKSYVDVIGESETNTIIQANNPNTTLIIGADQSMVSNVQIQGCTGTGVAAVVYSSPTTPQLNAIFYVENVRFGANYTHAKTIGTSGGNCIMQCSNVKYGGYPFTLGFHVTNNGSGVGRMQLRNVTSTNGGVTTTSGLVFAKADQPNCAFIVNGCLLTKASGAAAGTGFWVENGGSLRLTGVNFQRWATGIYAPQTGSAPSVEAIALNFENCTTDVNIIHSGTTGKIQGTDNYTKTFINIDAPLYEVNKDPRIITVAKKGGDFSSIKAAVDSITGSSTNNRFLISVGPGKFIENEIDLTGKPYVSIEGSNIITTEVVPNTNTQHIFKIGQNNELSFLKLSDASIGYAGIYVYDIGDYAQAHKISFTDCDTNVWIESHTQDTKFYGEYLDFNGSYSYGTKIIAYNGYVAYANMENYYNLPTGTGTTIGNHVQGSGATLSVFIGDGIGNGGVDSANYQILDYASLNTISTTAYNWDYGIRVLNIGGPSRFDIDSYSVVDSLVYDLSIEHPNTFGTFGGGSASHAKINNLSDDVYWAFLDIEDGEFDITRKISITFDKDTHTDASTLIFESGTMGLMDGGIITHLSGLTFDVSAGFGYLKKTVGVGIYMRIDWSATQITLLPNSENYLYFNENEILSSSGSAPENVNNIILGRVVTNSSTVSFIDVTPYNSSHTSNLLSTFNRNALGPIYAIGSIVTENATPYHLNISAGDYYYSENNFKPSGGTDVSFTQYYRDGGTGWITTGTTEVVNGYDDNSGTISPLPLSSFTKHTLYVVGEGNNEKYMLVLGQTYYTTLVEAEGDDLPTPPNYFDDAVTTIATILIQQGMSGITEIQDIRPVIGFKATGISASAVHGNLLGLTADDHKQYLLVDGSRAMSNNLSMGGNAIVSALTVNGVTVESHASRHKNGGADEIATATPAPSEIPKSDTFGKLDGWISDASISVKGLSRLSHTPASATVPIAVGVNDPRFLNSITAVTNTTPSLVFTNNSGGTTTLSNIRLSAVTATTIFATTAVTDSLSVKRIYINDTSEGMILGEDITSPTASGLYSNNNNFQIIAEWDFNTNVYKYGNGALSYDDNIFVTKVNGNLLTSTLTVTGNPTDLQYVIINNDLDLFNSQVETNNYGTYGRLRLFRASGTQASPTTPSSGSALGRLEFGAWNSATSTFIANAKIEASMDATSGINDLPSRLTFFTTPDGSTTMTERMRINSAGNLRIGGVAMSLSDVINVEGGSVAFQNGYGLRFQSTGGTIYASVYSNNNDTVVKSLGNAIRFKNRTGSSNLMSILDNGFVGVNTNTPTEYFHVNGNTRVDGLLTTEKGVDDSIGLYSNFRIEDCGLYFIGRNGSDFDNFGSSEFLINPEKGFSYFKDNASNSYVSSFNIYDNNITSVVSTVDNTGFIRNRVTNSGDTFYTETEQTNTSFKILNQQYTDDGLFSIRYDINQVVIGDTGVSGSGTYILVNDNDTRIALTASDRVDVASPNVNVNGTLKATTISATTYQNLPIDIRVTGGTYSSGTTVFRNNTGGTFSVTGFSTGSVSSVSGNMVNSTIPSAPVVQNTSTSVFRYSLSTSILSANTGTINGTIRLNNLNFSGVTQIYIHENSLNESAYYYLADLKIGDDVQIQTENNLSLTRYKISGTPIDNGSYFTLPVTFKSSIGLKPLSTSTVLVSLNIYGDTISLPVDSRAQKLDYLAQTYFDTPNDFVYYPSVYTLKQALLSKVLNPTRTLQQVVVAGQEADRVNFKHYYWNLTPYPTNFMLELQNGTYFIARDIGPYYWLSNNGSALTGYYFSYNSVESPKNAAQKSTGELYIIEGNYIQSYDTLGSSLDTWYFPNLNGLIRTFCFSSDENFLFVGGDFTIPYGIAKINSLTGEINNTFDNGTFDKFNDSVYSIVVYGSYLIVTGKFTTYDGNPVSGIVKIDSGDSGYYAVFITGFDIIDNGSGYSNQITSDITNPDLAIFYGVFTSFESYSTNRIIRMNLFTNTQDTSFVIGTGFDGTVINVTVIDGGLRYLVEGDFATYNVTSCDSGVIILNYDGSVNQAFNTGYKIIGAVRRDNGILGSYNGYIQYFENNIAYPDVTRSLTFDETTGFAEYSATFGKTFDELLPNEIITKQTLPLTTFTGGTVSGATSFTGGLTATTISATTYLNLPATSQSFISVSVDTVLTNDNQTVIVDSTNPITITLPQITGDGRLITIKNINTGIETILPYSGQLIDGDPSVIVARKNVSLDFQSYNNNWYLI